IEGNKGLVETTSGLSYEVNLVPSIISKSILGKTIDIYTQLIVREDSQTLYGFANKEESDLFKLLLSISGIGPKVSFGIISFSKTEQLLKAVKLNDLEYFTRIPGLGRKTALKLIVELSSKFDSEFSMSNIYMSEDDRLIVDALVSLGFKSNEAKKILSETPKNLSVEERIKKGIQLGTSKKK
ncbi:MAG: Holliday junction branch migration protein RuvA, partial [Patescibacteria group bacterium]